MERTPPVMTPLFWQEESGRAVIREELGVHILPGEGNNHERLIVCISVPAWFFCIRQSDSPTRKNLEKGGCGFGRR